MNYQEMTVAEIEAIIDEKGIDRKGVRKKDDLIALIPLDAKPKNVAEKVKSALSVTKTVTKTVDKYAYLADRKPHELTTAERLIVKQRSAEYQSVEGGVIVRVTDRLATPFRIVNISGKFTKFVKGETYTLAEEDYEAIKNEVVRVKTEATKDKCCGAAVYEDAKLLEVVNG